MGLQLDLFVCALHGPGHVCDRCPEGYPTDGHGFVHPSLRRGRAALRLCPVCRALKTREEWSPELPGYCAACATIPERYLRPTPVQFPLDPIAEAAASKRIREGNRQQWLQSLARRAGAAR